MRKGVGGDTKKIKQITYPYSHPNLVDQGSQTHLKEILIL